MPADEVPGPGSKVALAYREGEEEGGPPQQVVVVGGGGGGGGNILGYATGGGARARASHFSRPTTGPNGRAQRTNTRFKYAPYLL